MKLKDISECIGGKIEGDDSIDIMGIASIEEAKEGQITYISHSKYESWISKTDASCIIVKKGSSYKTDKTLILVEDPTLAFIKMADIFSKRTPPPAGISPLAYVAEGAVIDKTASVGAFCILGRGCRLGKKTVLHPQVYVGDETVIGDNCIIYPGVIIREDVQIKNSVVIHPNCVIGADGFGYKETPTGIKKIPHIGGVIIEDEVEIGANTTVDRAKLGKTIIGRGTKIDNLVQIAHNVIIGENCIIVSQTGIAGSVEIGNNVVIAGQVGITDHVKIGDNVKIGAKSGISKSIKDNETVWGIPAREINKAKKSYLLNMRLPEIYGRLKKLEEKLEKT